MKTLSIEEVGPEALDNTMIAEVDHDDRLIRWILGRTPAQRLETLQNFVEGIVALRDARRSPSKFLEQLRPSTTILPAAVSCRMYCG